MAIGTPTRERSRPAARRADGATPTTAQELILRSHFDAKLAELRIISTTVRKALGAKT